MSNITPRTSRSLSQNDIPDGFNRTEGKHLARLQNREITEGLVAATRIQSAAMVTAVAVQATGMLCREAAFQADGDPEVANRVGHLVDQFTAFAGSTIGQFGR